MQRKALGKGLEALLSDKILEEVEGQHRILTIDIHRIVPNKYQPRKVFDDDAIADLASSIKTKGVIQPITVRKSKNGGYELIAGERRLRAAQLAGCKDIPVIVKKASEEDMLELALIENLQREDLNPIEEAKAYYRLLREFSFTQEKIAGQVGKDRSSIANTLRLLSLPKEIQDDISSGNISTGHAKVILSIQDRKRQFSVEREVIKKGLSVRETESLIKRVKKERKYTEEKKELEILTLEEELKRGLQTKINIVQQKKGGKIIIEYYSSEELERIRDIILGQ
ncbi:MAG: ParB/RepB/Spo0J family partition protein [Nitrospirota bacterium]